jgi:enoyl-CoA hydratase
MSDPVVLVEKDQNIATLTLNRPKAMNALSFRLREGIVEAVSEIETDPEIKVVILTGAGKAFCAGLDLKELGSKGLLVNDDTARSETVSSAFSKLQGFDRPLIGAINGAAITGGFELALACDILFASSNAFFADTHARIGYIPGGGLSQILPRIIGPGRAKELSFTGNFLSAEKAEKWGLVNRVLPPEELMPACLELAKEITSCVPEVVHGYKRLINKGLSSTLEEGLQLEAKTYREYASQVSAESVAERRQGVMERGRKQKGKE